MLSTLNTRNIMTQSAFETYKGLSDAVVGMDETSTVEISRRSVAEGIDAYQSIEQGLVDGMNRAGQLFETEEYFIPELLLCADAMYAGLEVLKPHIRREDSQVRRKVIIGVVEGDTHDIGKNLVKVMLDAAGFEVHDLGRDVPPQVFVDTAIAESADIIGLSTLMTTTMPNMAEVVRLLEKSGKRSQFKVIVGGGPVSQSFADKIGADGYSANAPGAVKLAKKLLATQAA
jgi:corrinoid protein of di/trimethylamine methyltransferase